jgi:predicted dienelactone hydrolase
VKRLFLAIATLFAGACCTSLPRVPAKKLALPAREPSFARASESRAVWRDEKRHRDVPVTIYTPEGAHERLPVVVFSHGIGEDRDSYAWLGRAFARHGYMSVHITHAGTDRAVLERGYRHLYRAVKQPENWVARPLDVTFVLDRLEARDDVDMTRVAAVGHSAGAFTSFAVAGAQTANGETLRDARIKVAIPMSMPRLGDVIPPRGYDAIDIPLLNLTGTCDTSIVYFTFPRHRRIPFESTRAPSHLLVTLAGANHDSFVLEDAHREAIVSVTIAFLDAWLRDDRGARAWFEEAGRGEVAGTAISVERKTGGAR